MEEDDSKSDKEILEVQGTTQKDHREEKEEMKIRKLINNRKLSEIKIKPPIKLQSLFSNKLSWDIRNGILSFLYLIFLLLVLITVCLSIVGHNHLNNLWKEMNNITFEIDDLEEGAIVSYCVTIIPVVRGDILEINNLPYASLPFEKFHFNKPGPLLSFVDCYKAYWMTLQSNHGKFENARLKFYSSSNHIVCKQLSLGEFKVTGSDYCLTLNIKMPFSKSGWFSFFNRRTEEKYPVVVLLSGRTFLENNPFLVGDSVVLKSQAIFITINFRLGVLGFSNFGSMKSPKNIGIIDFLKAMEYMHKYIGKFQGDRNNMTLFAEESGATVGILYMLMNKDVNWFSKIWLIDGSTYIPNPPARSLFYDMYASSDILCSIFSELDDVFNCLQNFSSNLLLNNTPNGWIQANQYFDYLPDLFEVRKSLVEKIENMIFSPLETLMQTESNIADVPIVIMSKIDNLPDFNKFQTKNISLTKSELFTITRLGFLSYQSLSSQVLINKEITTAYNGYTKFIENRSIYNHFINKEVIPLGFEEVLKAIITDLRNVCPYTAVAKYLQVNGHINQNSIYRIFDGGYRYTTPPMDSFSRCDLNFILQDDFTACKSKSKDLPREYRESLLQGLVDFINRGSIDNIQKMIYPLNSTMRHFEETFTFVGRLGFRTPGVRETGMLQACNIWRKGTDELPMLKTSAKVN